MKIFKDFFKLVLINVLFFQFSFGISYANSLQPAQPTLENFILDNLINDTVSAVKTMVDKNELPELNEKTSKYEKLKSMAKELLAKNPHFLKNLKIERKGNILIMASGNNSWVIDYKDFLKTGVFSFAGKKLEFKKLHELNYVNKIFGVDKTSSYFRFFKNPLVNDAHAGVASALGALGMLALIVWLFGSINNWMGASGVITSLERIISKCQGDLASVSASSGKADYLETHLLVDTIRNYMEISKDLPENGKVGNTLLNVKDVVNDDLALLENIVSLDYQINDIRRLVNEYNKCVTEFAKVDEMKGRNFNDSRQYEKTIGDQNPYYGVLKKMNEALRN